MSDDPAKRITLRIGGVFKGYRVTITNVGTTDAELEISCRRVPAPPIVDRESPSEVESRPDN